MAESGYFNTDCMLNGTQYCIDLGQKSCEECRLLKSKSDDQREAMVAIDRVRDLLPDGSLSELIDAQSCQFCKGEHHYKKSNYAITDFGHVEPQGTKVSVIGIKVKTQVGSIVPLQIPCCQKCRNNLRIASFMTMGVMFLVMVIAMLILSSGFRVTLEKISDGMPLLCFLGSIVVGYFLGKVVTKVFTNAKSKETEFDVFNIPYVGRMRDNGWFSIYGEKKAPKLYFSNHRLKSGWFIY